MQNHQFFTNEIGHRKSDNCCGEQFWYRASSSMYTFYKLHLDAAQHHFLKCFFKRWMFSRHILIEFWIRLPFFFQFDRFYFKRLWELLILYLLPRDDCIIISQVFQHIWNVLNSSEIVFILKEVRYQDINQTDRRKGIKFILRLRQSLLRRFIMSYYWPLIMCIEVYFILLSIYANL